MTNKRSNEDFINQENPGHAQEQPGYSHLENWSHRLRSAQIISVNTDNDEEVHSMRYLSFPSNSCLPLVFGEEKLVHYAHPSQEYDSDEVESLTTKETKSSTLIGKRR